jgi:hypothetical protein
VVAAQRALQQLLVVENTAAAFTLDGLGVHLLEVLGEVIEAFEHVHWVPKHHSTAPV